MENICRSSNRACRTNLVDIKKQKGLSNKSLINSFTHAISICSVGDFQYLELVRQPLCYVVKLRERVSFTTPIYFYLLAVSKAASFITGVDTFIAQLTLDSSIHLSSHL